ncbi:hypothetical protein GCM10009557_42590 [Virgisporangium ochraceum]|uniref:Uncharacterized protein n=1 Tax=Virgisporangium ochraceum TaxID=65505 RepID=A0A8J4A406_9ACTN|nr:hypothetical protein Voc01_102060 [Virgisporangium ochraceum]
MSSADFVSFGLVVDQDHRLLGDEKLAWSEDVSSLGRVLRGYEIGMGAVRVFCGDSAHAWAESRQDSDGVAGRYGSVLLALLIHCRQVVTDGL